MLDANWLGRSTTPSRTLYPHQWSWDSAFIAIGRSWYDEPRARLELDTLFDAQWSNGMVPHIVFDPSVPEDAYFPGPAFWASDRSPHAPRSVRTSGITQPPLHARAALESHRHATDVAGSLAWLRRLYPRLRAQHAYLDRHRDPLGTGLPTIVHPWETGLDNSPVWDRDLRDLRIPQGGIPTYRRHDIRRVAAADRPTDETYDAFVYLAVRYRDSGYDDDHLLEHVGFAVAGPLFTAIHLWSTHALAEIARLVDADPSPHEIAARRIHEALIRELWDPALGRFAPKDLLTGRRQPERTIVSFAPLLDPDLPEPMVQAICADLETASFRPDAPDHFVVPTDDLRSPDFDRRRYWRGPVWLNTNWLLWSGLRQHGRDDLADAIASSSLRLVERSGFHEYFDPFDGSGRGSADFGWSAALTIDLIHRRWAAGA